MKKYKPTKFKAKNSVYNEELADYAVDFIQCLLEVRVCMDLLTEMMERCTRHCLGIIGDGTVVPVQREAETIHISE